MCVAALAHFYARNHKTMSVRHNLQHTFPVMDKEQRFCRECIELKLSVFKERIVTQAVTSYRFRNPRQKQQRTTALLSSLSRHGIDVNSMRVIGTSRVAGASTSASPDWFGKKPSCVHGI